MSQNEPPGEDGKRDAPITEAEPEDENPTISAGYTYLGQFIDHDITFDPASTLDKLNDPDALEDFRTPRLDLDSVYGRGPDDAPYLYRKAPRGKDATELLTGIERHPPKIQASRPDHQRNAEDVALLGDPRNDENILVGQIHNLFVRFHNKVVGDGALVPASLSEKARFVEAQRLVRWHYQWLIIHDYLPRVVGESMTNEVLGTLAKRPKAGSRGEPSLRFYKVQNSPYMPVEFSVAAFRFGHSMIRPSYSLSEDVLVGSDSQNFNRVPLFTMDANPLANLNGFRPLPESWGLDWSFFFDVPRRQAASADLKLPQP